MECRLIALATLLYEDKKISQSFFCILIKKGNTNILLTISMYSSQANLLECAYFIV